MSDPCYFTKFTLKDYLAGQQKEVSHPPIPSGMDYIRANAFLNKQVNESAKTSISLSAEAKPFEPRKPSFIVVFSFKNPSVSYEIPVFPSKRTCCLPLSTLHQYFPLATSMHYNNIQQQLVTVATVGNYSIVQGRIEVSQKMFCIPFLGSNFQYFVTESEDIEENRSCSKAPMNGEAEVIARNIRAKLTTALTDMELLEKEIAQLQQRIALEDSLVDEIISKERDDDDCIETILDESTDQVDVEGPYTNENGNQTNLGLEQPHVKQEFVDFVEDPTKSSLVIGSSLSVKSMAVRTDEYAFKGNGKCERNFMDDYGFSDSDEDMIVNVNSVVEEVKNDESIGEPEPIQQKFDNAGISVSTRPRCIRRVVRK